jgi:hypothetical protein
MEDGASGYKGFAIKCRELNEMDCIQWSARSPDLNLIEVFLLDMETELEETWSRASNVEELEELLKAC